MLVLESWPKASLAFPWTIPSSREQLVGPLGRAIFSWLIQLFICGMKKGLTVQDLFPVEPSMCPPVNENHLMSLWVQSKSIHRLQIKAFLLISHKGGEKKKPYHLLGLIIKAFSSEIISCVVPRAAYIGFVIAQPYLIRRAVTLFALPHEKNAHDRGVLLIAAFALVYVGMGVGLTLGARRRI